MSLTAWLAVGIFITAYVLIATEKVHRVAAALGGAVLMLVVGATDAEHAFFSEEAAITVALAVPYLYLRFFAFS